MNTKRMMRWIIVLFLLAALPVITAVRAQEEVPANQLSENDYCGDPFPGYPGGRIEMNSVVNGYVERLLHYPYYIYHNIWTFELPSASAVWVNVRKTGGYGKLNVDEIGAAGVYEAEGLLYLPAGEHCIAVWAEWEDNPDRNLHVDYSLEVLQPLLISAGAGGFLNGGNVGGVQFYSQDILGHADRIDGTQRWVMIFDGSDVGITANVTNIAASGNDNELLLSFAANQTLPGVGTVTPWDIVVFDPTSLGRNTAGTFRWGLQGGQHGLTTAGEKLDGIDGWVNGHDLCYGFPVSTTGVANTPSWGTAVVKADNEDVFCKVYDGSWQPWRYFFDVKGKNNSPNWWVPGPGRVPGMPAEDVIALAYDDATDVMYLTIQGNGNILGNRVTQKDIFAINFPSYTWGGIVWHGPDHGWNYNIDAIEFNGW